MLDEEASDYSSGGSIQVPARRAEDDDDLMDSSVNEPGVNGGEGSSHQHESTAKDTLPHGRMTIIPAMLGFTGSAASFLAVFSPWCDGSLYLSPSEGSFISVAFILGIVSGTIGAMAFIISTIACSRLLSARMMKILGCTYLTIAMTSILMLVVLVECNILNIGGAFAIVAFLVYLGAGVVTLLLVGRKNVDHTVVTSFCPYGCIISPLPFIFGATGTALAFLSITAPSYAYYTDEGISVSLLGNQDDGALTFAFTMGFLAGVFGLMLIVLDLLLIWQRIPLVWIKIMGYAYLALGVMCVLTLVGLSSDTTCADDCVVGPGGTMAIYAFIAYITACMAVFHVYKYVRPS